jgi:hypothetical protein
MVPAREESGDPPAQGQVVGLDAGEDRVVREPGDPVGREGGPLQGDER